jgi:sigma-B regulation protein RsbU (phosphoserine phosphatase)
MDRQFDAAGEDSATPTIAAEAVHSIIEQTRILKLLYDISQELTSILDFDDLLRTVGARVKQLVDYDLFNVMLLNQDSQRLHHALSIQYDQRIQLQTELALGAGLCGAAAMERKPIRVNRVGQDPRYIQCVGAPDVQSELVVPLIVKDRLLGVLDLESLQPDAFTSDHEQMLATLAASVAIALENARLYDQLRRAEQRKTEDLDRARELQLLLLPTTMPELPGIEIAVLYLPAQELGGDFYDFLHYKDGCLAIAVGDVAGKGSAAALLASLGVGMLREHVMHAPSQPAEMLADLNGHLLTPGRRGRFIAMAYGVYDASRRELCLANAGFPQPLRVRDKKVEVIDVSGVPLGLFEESTYDSIRLQLEPGDMIVFCSDGIHEQTNAIEEEFGLDRLISQLTDVSANFTVEQVAANIVHAIENYAGFGTSSGTYTDDRTIVVLRIPYE